MRTSLQKRVEGLKAEAAERAVVRVQELFAVATPEQLARLAVAGERRDGSELDRIGRELGLTGELFDCALAGAETPAQREERYVAMFSAMWRRASASPPFHGELARLRAESDGEA